MTLHLICMPLSVALLASAMLFPFLPGRHDPLAVSLAAAATVAAFGGLLLVPIGVAWLISSRGYALARLALAAASLVAIGAALATVASGSMAAGDVLLAAWVVWLVHLWRHVGAARTAGADLPRAVPIALIMVPLVAVAVRTALVGSAAAWSRDRAIANAAEIVSDIERFRERTGAYPVAINS